jgi:uncharacterized membrane protein
MDNLVNFGKGLFAIALAVFGIQHFMYAGFVATLVPGWIPWHLFFTYLTGAAFIAVAISIIINKYTALAAALLSIEMGLFVVLLHIPQLLGNPHNVQQWTRFLQDVAIMGTAMVLIGDARLPRVCKYLFAVPMIGLGAQHFFHVDFVTAKVPAYFPAATMWDYFVGAVIIILAIGVVSNRYLAVPAFFLACFLLFFAVLYHVPLLIATPKNGILWTGAMLDIAITGGAFILQRNAFYTAAKPEAIIANN